VATTSRPGVGQVQTVGTDDDVNMLATITQGDVDEVMSRLVTIIRGMGLEPEEAIS
jgi:hypothetical protein